eukprot:gene11645-biopygen1848
MLTTRIPQLRGRGASMARAMSIFFGLTDAGMARAWRGHVQRQAEPAEPESFFYRRHENRDGAGTFFIDYSSVMGNVNAPHNHRPPLRRSQLRRLQLRRPQLRRPQPRRPQL